MGLLIWIEAPLSVAVLLAIFLGPYLLTQLLPRFPRWGAALVGLLALIFLIYPARSLPKHYGADASFVLILVCVAIIFGAIYRTLGPPDKTRLDRRYWAPSVAVGLFVMMFTGFMAGMTTDDLG